MLRGRRDELGNVFALLFGAVALVGVLGKASMDTLTGPVTTSQRVTQKARAESDMLNAANVLVRAAGTARGCPAWTCPEFVDWLLDRRPADAPPPPPEADKPADPPPPDELAALLAAFETPKQR